RRSCLRGRGRYRRRARAARLSAAGTEATMARNGYCVFLKREPEGLRRVPYPGELGKRIFDNISKAAWQQWLGHQTMLMNEYRLSPIEPQGRKVLPAGKGEVLL